MKRFFLSLCFAALGVFAGYGQTLKSLMYNTTNGTVIYSGTNMLTFTNDVRFGGGDLTVIGQVISGGGVSLSFEDGSLSGAIVLETNSSIVFQGSSAATTRTNLGLGATWLTNTNVTNFRTAIGLGATNSVSIGDDGGSLTTDDLNAGNVNVSSAVTFTTNTAAAATRTNLGLGATWLTNTTTAFFRFDIGIQNQEWTSNASVFYVPISFGGDGEANSGGTRTNLRLGATNIVTFAGLTNNGDITINSTTASNGLLYIRRTNNEPFLGLANLIASNNTTISNETLFRVGAAEATNRSAQFGFRTVRTNNGGEGFAVFSVFGYNALMMIGPSDRSRTNTATNAGIEADIWTIAPTNRVATLRDTNSGAFTLHQELGFSTNNLNTNAPATNNTVALWIRVWIGTNSYRLPLYQ
jgi:hypothetical protein